MSLDFIVVQHADADGADNDAEWRLNVTFGADKTFNPPSGRSPVPAAENPETTYHLRDNSVHNGDQKFTSPSVFINKIGRYISTGE